MMNCFEFRKICITEPRCANDAYRRHRDECPACAAFAERQDDFERALTAAVEVEVPAGLDARVILRQTTEQAFSSRRRFMYAASVLVTLGLAGGLLWRPRAQPVDELVMAHILDEPEHLMSQDVVPRERAASVLASLGMAVQGDLGVIRFAARCPGRPGAHLVLAGSHGPVTVMIMPDHPVPGRQMLARSGFTGVIAPAGKGSVAVVGMPGEAIEQYEARVRSAIADLA
jgi:hypothetical protein